MKKIISLMLFIGLISIGLASAFSGSGSGTAGDPFEITTCAQLQEMEDALSSQYRLVNDIDCDVAPFNTGLGFDPVGEFRGTFDGQGFEISGLFIINTGISQAGLFGRIRTPGIVKDFGLIDADVTCSSSCGAVAGILLEAGGTIERVYVSGRVVGFANIGCIAGTNVRGLISDSYSSCDVTASNPNSGFAFGGLVGNNFEGDISNSYATGRVNGSDDVGGLVGNHQNSGVISNSFATGSVIGTNAFGPKVGGLIGRNDAVISNSRWDIPSSGRSNCVGGGSGGSAGCTGELDPNYFKGAVSARAPVSSWDFTTIWAKQVNLNDYPIFKFQVPPIDTDFDGIFNSSDNCPVNSNSGQEDGDSDGVGNVCDVCPAQGFGAGLLLCTFENAGCISNDPDGDLFCETNDNCPAVSNPGQADSNSDGAGDACQPTVVINSITQDGGTNLEVDAAINDPNGDTLSGDIIYGIGLGLIILDDSISLTDTLEPGATITRPDFEFGAYEGNNVEFSCGTCAVATFLDAVDVLGQKEEICGYDTSIVQFIVENDDKICARSTLTGNKFDIDFLCHSRDSKDPVENPAGSCAGAGGASSYLRSGSGLFTAILSVPYTGSLPSSFPLSGLTSGETFILKITTTDGNTPEVSDSKDFLYQGESFLTFGADSDGDGVDDGSDNCPDDANPDQSDLDTQNGGDVCDAPVMPDLPFAFPLLAFAFATLAWKVFFLMSLVCMVLVTFFP